VVTIGVLAAACTSATPTPEVWDESVVVAHLRLVQDPGGIAWTYESDGLTCNVAAVLTTATQVAMYADAGDVVAANPDRSAGVKIVSAESAACLAALNAALADLQ
jgi:hypothetical protein